MTPSDLQAFIDENGITGEIIRLEVPTPTVETAAQAVGARIEQIIKSVLFIVAGRPVLAIASGTRPIDDRAIAVRYGVGRKQVRLADAATVESVTGYPAGGVPPFGHVSAIETLIDPEVLAQPFIFGGGGDHHSLLRISPDLIRQVSAAVVLPLVKA